MNIRLFAESFKKFDKRLINIILLEGAFFLIASFVLVGFMLLLKSVLLPLHDSVPLLKEAEDAKASQDVERLLKLQNDLGYYPAMMKNFFIRTAALVAALLSSIFLIISYFQGRVVSILTNKRFDMLFFRKFLILNIVWNFFWLFLYVTSFILVNNSLKIFIAAFWFVVYIYFTTLIYLNFNKNKGIFSSIKEPIAFGIRYIHKIILSYILSYCILVLLVLALSFFYSWISTVLFLIIIFFLLLVYTSWFFLYLSRVVSHVKE